MTYEALENSPEAGRPLELYVFQLGNSTWRYTSADQDLVVDTNTFKAVPMKNSGIVISGEASAEALTIEAPSTIGPAQLFMTVPPSQSIWVQIWRKHEGDDEYLVSYQGEISQVNFPMPGKAKIVCETLSASFQREGLRLPWSRTCPYAVYDPDTCKLDKGTQAVQIQVLSVSGATVVCTEVETYDNGYFNGGMFEWDDIYRGHEIRLVETHENSVLTMFNTAEGMYVGLVGYLYRGCRQTVESCKELNNFANYGGIPHLPGKSPFDGNPIF